LENINLLLKIVLRTEKPLEKIYEAISSSEDKEESEEKDKDRVNILLANNSVSDNIGIDFDYNSNNNDIELDFRNSILKSGLNSSINNNIQENINLNKQNISINSDFKADNNHLCVKENQLPENDHKKVDFLRKLEKIAFSHLNKNISFDKNSSKNQTFSIFFSNENENLSINSHKNQNDYEGDSNKKIENSENIANFDNINIGVDGSNIGDIQEKKINIIQQPIKNSNQNAFQYKEEYKSELQIIMNPLNQNFLNDSIQTNNNLNSENIEILSINKIAQGYVIKEHIKIENEIIDKKVDNNDFSGKNIIDIEEEENLTSADNFDENNNNKPRIVLIKQQLVNSSSGPRNTIKNNYN
jgi:hypothetical protein